MPSYYRVSPKIWNEPWSDAVRLLALYILSCPHRTTEGLFRLPRHYVIGDLGWGKRKIENALRELSEADFIRTHDDVVLVVKALKYQAPRNPNQMTGAIRELQVVPPTPLDQDFRLLAEQHAPLFAEELAKQLPNRFGTNPDSLGHALALAPSLALTPSSSPSETVDDDEQLRIFLKGEGFEDPEIDLALNRLRLRRAGFGAPVTDEAAWLRTVVQRLTYERDTSSPAEAPTAEIDGEKFRFVHGQWVVEPPA